MRADGCRRLFAIAFMRAMLSIEMSMKTHPLILPLRRLKGAVALSAFCMVLGASFAAAQAADPPVLAPPTELIPPIRAESQAPSPQASPQDQLDALFADLLTADDGARARITEDIAMLWSRSGSDSMDLLLRRGRMAMEAGELVRAVHHLTALTDHAPDFAEGWHTRATAFFLMEQWGLALGDIERTLALEPRHFGALSGLAVILEKVDRPVDAMAAWRRALALDPNLESAAEGVKRLETTVDGRAI
ncbi:MAG: putative Zn-dependent protease [Paracoccaceae bacterium]|jgi:predicted Zn-dependent protease